TVMRNLTGRNIAISAVSGKGLPVPSLGAETVPSSGRPSLAGTLGVWRASQSSAMSALPILELDHLVRNADPRRRALATRQLAELFQQGAAGFGSQHVAL